MKRRIPAVVVLCLVLLAASWLRADSTSVAALPESSRAIAAIRRFDRQFKAAKVTYRAAVLRADRLEYNSLLAAQQAAMHAGRANEVVRITTFMKSVSRRFEHDNQQGATVPGAGAGNGAALHVAVRAALDWVPVCHVEQGELITITATGTWSAMERGKLVRCGPEGILVNGNCRHYLNAQIAGAGAAVGAGRTILCTHTGLLQLSCATWHHANARGAVRATIRIDRR